MSTSEWPPLSLAERRVIGVLVEKAKTTPEAYPLSLNALTTGCNQKSNRDPVMNLVEEVVEEVLTACQHKGLVIKVTGGRVTRWRHCVYEKWGLDKADAAVITELLLRGPQTEGELRLRASRMEPIEDLESLRRILGPLEERKLVVYLGPKDRRGVQVTHGFHTPAELEMARNRMPAEEPAPLSAPVPRASEGEVSALKTQVAELTTQVADLQTQVQALAADLKQLKESLGVNP